MAVDDRRIKMVEKRHRCLSSDL